MWRSLIYRDGGASFAGARRPGLERETLATLLAETNGAPVWRVVTAGRPVGAGEALVLVRDGERAPSVPEGAFDDDAAGAPGRPCARCTRLASRTSTSARARSRCATTARSR